MYPVDQNDRVDKLAGLPSTGAGAPEVILFATDHRLLLVYAVPELEIGQVGPSGRVLAYEDLPPGYDPIALVEFMEPRAHFFGPPNDEALGGHPLASRGLEPYGAFEIQHSSWIRALERANRVHPEHEPARFSQLRHFVLTFHDSTFECVAIGISGHLYERDAPELARTLREIGRRHGVPG